MLELIQRIKYVKETPTYVLVEFEPCTSKYSYILTIVYKNLNKFFCSCEYFLYNSTKCKHILLLERYIRRELPEKYVDLLRFKVRYT